MAPGRGQVLAGIVLVGLVWSGIAPGQPSASSPRSSPPPGVKPVSSTPRTFPHTGDVGSVEFTTRGRSNKITSMR